MATARRPMHINPDAQHWNSQPSTSLDDAYAFHRTLPGYKPTDLIPLNDLAEELGVGKLYIKHEGDRFGLPSFKILGASWGTYRAVIREYDLPLGSDVETIRAAAARSAKVLFAATDGNHGRAVARLAKTFGMLAKIFVPANMDSTMIADIKGEGAEVFNTGKPYDDAIMEAERGSKAEGGLLIQDCGFDGYEELPEWIVEGYSTFLREIDVQLGDETADLVIVPVGVGSLGQAVVTHYRRPGSTTTVMSVEPDTAACLWKSLRSGQSESIRTTPTIMNGLDCGTVSTTAWPVMKAGTGASVTVADSESHQAILDLGRRGVQAGPCGASSLAALQRMNAGDKAALNLTRDSVVVLLSTEAARPYKHPLDVRLEDAGLLTETLTAIDSVSSRTGKHERPVETSIAEYVMAWLEHRDIECQWLERITGRPSVVGVVRGSGGGKTLMLSCGLDVRQAAGLREWSHAKPRLKSGMVFGTGAAKMKGGLAACLLAMSRAKTLNLNGDVVLVAVAGGEGANTGYPQVLQAGWHADGAITTSCTGEDVIHAHRGSVTLEVNVHSGVKSESGPGNDTMTHAAYFLVELDKCRRAVSSDNTNPADLLRTITVQPPQGTFIDSTTPSCTVFVEAEITASRSSDMLQEWMQSILDQVSQAKPSFRSSLRIAFQHKPWGKPASDPFVAIVSENVQRVLSRPAHLRDDGEWAEHAILAESGITTVAWGPKGASAGASEFSEEWVDIGSVERVAKGLIAVAEVFCS